MLGIPPALTHLFAAVRRSAASVLAEPKVSRLEQPVPRVVRLARRSDGFEGVPNERRQFAQPRPTDVTRYLRSDGFESAPRKLVELTPKPPPSYRQGVAVFRFR